MRWTWTTLISAAAIVGCGGGGGRDDESATAGMTSTITGGGPLSATNTMSASATEPTGGGSMSGGMSEGTSEGSISGGGDSDGIKFDLMPVPDGGVTCGGGGGQPDFSFIWIANSSQGTISKINTVTLAEEGRYIVRPDSAGSPSRTSVNLSGDVVVANRSGGLTKVYAQADRCAESNAMPGIQTAVDANFLPWGTEECIAWYAPMNYVSQRPVAWTQGTFNAGTCKWENQKVWTSGNNLQNGTLDVLRVNGDTGAVEAMVTVSGVGADYYGIYGAAVDKNGNFWGSQLGQQSLLFVDAQTLEYKIWPMAGDGYGMTVDSKGYVWTCASMASRFDPMTETWQTVPVGEYGGCMEDGKGTLYKANPGGIVAIDTETLAIKQTYALPEHIHGISIDFYGYVWAVAQGANAYRVNPPDGQYQTFTGLVGAYTYSDMTGFALSNVGTPTG